VSAGARRLGPFTVTGELGRGGMGTVLRARDPANREVALKLGPAGASDERRARFEREGQIAAGLDHPGIVRVHAAGALPDGRPYLAFELVEGARPLSAAAADLDRTGRLRALRDAAAAVAHAHARGVVHRDLKPQNVLVDAAGCVRVADFGLAAGRGLSPITQAGVSVGTPYYMAPEQVEALGRHRAPTTDVWALGVVLYQLLTDQLPFTGESVFELARAITSKRPVPPRQRDPSITPELAAVCRKALAKRQADRYPDAGAFVRDLEACLEGRRPTASRLGPAAVRRRRLAGLVAAGLVPIAVGAGAGALALRGPEPTPGPSPSPSGASPSEAAPSADAAVDDAAPSPSGPTAPDWLTALPADRRPPWPLPEGVARGPRPGTYRNAADGSVLVWVPPGEHLRGRDGGPEDEAPAHRVRLTRGVFLGEREVTWAQWLVFARERGLELAGATWIGSPRSARPVS